MPAYRYPLYVIRSTKTREILFVGLGARIRVLRRWQKIYSSPYHMPTHLYARMKHTGKMTRIELYKACDCKAEADLVMANFATDHKLVEDCRTYGGKDGKHVD